jgi:hypothetical protein
LELILRVMDLLLLLLLLLFVSGFKSDSWQWFVADGNGGGTVLAGAASTHVVIKSVQNLLKRYSWIGL